MKSKRCRQLVIRALFFLLIVSIHELAASSSTSNNNNHRSESDIDIVGPNLPRRLRDKEYSLNYNVTAEIQEEADEITPWYHPSRMLNPLTTCPWPDITSLANVRSGQYGSETVYVDGTENAADIDERDSTYMVEMAKRGYIAVTVDYDDLAIKYTDGCNSFHQKSQKIFDASVTGSVLHQLCYENDFGHRDYIPVDCQLGVVVNGWSQGAHVASLAGNYAPSLVTAGNSNWACGLSWSTCMWCVHTDVSCMNSNYISLPKEKRRNISGDRDTFFGACENWGGANNRENVIQQLQAVSGYSCSSSRNNCFRQNLNKAGYFVIPDKGHNFMDVSPASQFMNPETVWGLPSNLDWLAEQGRIISSPSIGVCSGNSGITAGNPCSESSECECGRWLQTRSDNNHEVVLALTKSDPSHRGLPKEDKKGGGGGGKQDPAPTPPVSAPVTPAPTSTTSTFCGCMY
eukprot:scaffold11304_cov135-Skeletonema_menzelii.AAC.4